MNELRRKLVVSAPLLTVGFLTGCGGGESVDDGAGSSVAGGRATPQATSGVTGQNLLVSAVWPYALDSIWANSGGGGVYLMPSTVPSIQAVINGSVLHLSIVEQVVVSSTVKIIKSLTMALAVPTSGTALAAGAIYPINGTTNTARVSILKRTTSSSTTITDQIFAYAPSASGTVKISLITPVSGGSPKYKLTFSTVKFQAVSGTGASNPFTLSGDTTLSTPTETATWV